MDRELRPPDNLLPHRPPFLFIDRVTECNQGGIRAVRRFRSEEDFFLGHFPGNPIVPGVLLLEAMAQAFAYWAVENEGADGVYLTGVDRARFRKPVLPGQEVELVVCIEGGHLGLVRASAEAWVEHHKVADARLMGYSTPAAKAV